MGVEITDIMVCRGYFEQSDVFLREIV